MKTARPFDSAPYQKAILQIQSVEKKVVREIRAEAEKYDRKKEISNFKSFDAS